MALINYTILHYTILGCNYLYIGKLQPNDIKLLLELLS